MNVNLDALWFLLVGAAIVGGLRMLLKRMDDIELTLGKHGRKLIRIETKLGIPDRNGDENE